jgi:UDP-N-acetylglucosamine--N-acetylmuramyl-(pentapeptide) pyrophosphoryl-undecaprenol N-acetylglucosamine transferase
LTKEQARQNIGLENKLTICIMGGSQGAKKINDAAVGILRTLSERNIQVIFQTGKKNYDEVSADLDNIYPEYKNDKNIIVKPYFDNMSEVLKASDIAVSRAGSLSISELCASGVAAIFIPYAYAAADHQRKNAAFMLDSGAGLYLEDSETNSNSLLSEIDMLVNDSRLLDSIKQNALSLAKFDGVERIIKQINDCC